MKSCIFLGVKILKKMVHIQRNLGELYRGRSAMGLKYVVAGLSVMAKSDVSARNSLHITPSAHISQFFHYSITFSCNTYVLWFSPRNINRVLIIIITNTKERRLLYFSGSNCFDSWSYMLKPCKLLKWKSSSTWFIQNILFCSVLQNFGASPRVVVHHTPQKFHSWLCHLGNGQWVV